MTPAYVSANQYLATGCSMAQQAAMAEAAGNAMLAAQGYDQAIVWIQQSGTFAMQAGLPIPDSVHFTLALAQFNAARMKFALGIAPMAWANLTAALASVNQAIAINPSVSQYHTAAGTILMSMGNAPEANRALTMAMQLNPMDPAPRSLFSALQSQMGPMTWGQSGGGMAAAPGRSSGDDPWAHASGVVDFIGKLAGTVTELGKMWQQFGGGGYA